MSFDGKNSYTQRPWYFEQKIGWRAFWQRTGGYWWLTITVMIEFTQWESRASVHRVQALQARNPSLHLLHIRQTHKIGKSKLCKHFGWNILSVAGDPILWRECAPSPLSAWVRAVNTCGKLFLQLKISRNINMAHHNCWLICFQRIDSRFGLFPLLPLLPLLVHPEVHGAIILHMLNDYPMTL